MADKNRAMSEYIHQLKVHRRQLKSSQQQLEEDNARLKKQVHWYQESNAIVAKDLMKLQETCTQLQVSHRRCKRARTGGTRLVFEA